MHIKLEMNGLNIVRVNKKLLVNDTLHDSEGQGYINNRFGYLFRHTGYMKQDCFEQFCYMKPQAKLNFLENFAFENVNVTEIKDRVSKKIKIIKNDVTLIDAKVKMLDELLKNSKDDLGQIPKKLKDSETKTTKKDLEIKIDERVKVSKEIGSVSTTVNHIKEKIENETKIK